MTDRQDLNELLTDRDQILMAAWMLPNEGTLTDSQRRQAMDNFLAYCRSKKITFAQVAKHVGKPRTSLIRDLTKGVYRENADAHIRTLNMWIEQHARQQAVKLPGSFVETKVALNIIAMTKLIRENQTMGLIYGPTGIGKTRCAQALYETYVGSILLTVVFGAYHPKGLTRLLAEALSVRTAARSQSEFQHLTQLERVTTRLAGSNRLIIVDEAHKLTDPALELLREIHDTTGCPMVLFAVKELHDRIKRSADPDHGQLYSRFDIARPLTQGRDLYAGGTNKPLFTVEEIKKLYEQTPIRLSPDATKYLRDVANHLGYGSLRRCRILLTNAARRARKRQGVSEEDTVTVTADDLAFVETRLRQEAGEQKLAKERRRIATAATG